MAEDLYERAHTVAGTHADLLAAALGPGRVRAVWLTGSTMLRDLTTGSDIDSVTLLSSPPSRQDEEALGPVHATLAGRFPGVRYDTTYLDAAWLARPPEPGLVVPQSIDGALILDQPAGELHPVTWFTLPQAVHVTGDHPGDVEIAADAGTARAHSRENLRGYWLESVAPGLRTALGDRPADDPLEHPGTVVWVVLGAPRLAMFQDPYAEYAGPIPSKTEAGRWVVRHLPAYAELATRSLASRSGQDVRFTVADARAAAHLIESLVP